MTDEEVIRALMTGVARLEEKEIAMDRRMDDFQQEMKQVGEALNATTKTLNAIRNVLILVVFQLIATGVLESKPFYLFLKGLISG